jgi:hypothetical protein
MLASKSSSKNTRKLNLQLVMNIELFPFSDGFGIGFAWCC